jgi:hypothetical protein
MNEASENNQSAKKIIEAKKAKMAYGERQRREESSLENRPGNQAIRQCGVAKNEEMAA